MSAMSTARAVPPSLPSRPPLSPTYVQMPPAPPQRSSTVATSSPSASSSSSSSTSSLRSPTIPSPPPVSHANSYPTMAGRTFDYSDYSDLAELPPSSYQASFAAQPPTRSSSNYLPSQFHTHTRSQRPSHQHQMSGEDRLLAYRLQREEESRASEDAIRAGLTAQFAKAARRPVEEVDLSALTLDEAQNAIEIQLQIRRQKKKGLLSGLKARLSSKPRRSQSSTALNSHLSVSVPSGDGRQSPSPSPLPANVDVDAMTYEELLALSEAIGDVKSKGFSEAEIARLPTAVWERKRGEGEPEDEPETEPAAGELQLGGKKPEGEASDGGKAKEKKKKKPGFFARMRSSNKSSPPAASSAPSAAISPHPAALDDGKSEKVAPGAGAGEGGGEQWRDKCSICLESFRNGELIKFLPCLTGDHRVLTRGGWKTITQVKVGEDVLSLKMTPNADGQYVAEWKPVTAVINHVLNPNKDEDRLYRMQGMSMDVVATRNHNMLVASVDTNHGLSIRNDEPLRYETVAQLLSRPSKLDKLSTLTQSVYLLSRNVVRGGFNTQAPIKIVIPGLERVCDWWWARDQQVGFLKFLGFWLGDGYLNTQSGYVVIGQKKEESTKWLIELLQQVFPGWWFRCFDTQDAKGVAYKYFIRCLPLYEYLRKMAVGPVGYNPRDPSQLRSYPHFTYDWCLAAQEHLSSYYKPGGTTVNRSTWTEERMLAALNEHVRAVVDEAGIVAAAERDAISAFESSIPEAPPAAWGEFVAGVPDWPEVADWHDGPDWLEVPDWVEVPDWEDVPDWEEDGVSEVEVQAPVAKRQRVVAPRQQQQEESSAAVAAEVAEVMAVVDAADTATAPEGAEEVEEWEEETKTADFIPTAGATSDPKVAAEWRVAGMILVWNGGLWLVINGHWFYLKRWMGDEQQIASVYSRLSREQAVALLDGFCRADGDWARVAYDEDNKPRGQWRCSGSSFPLMDHLMLIAQLAGAAVHIERLKKAGAAGNIDGRKVTFTVDHWRLFFMFSASKMRDTPTSMQLSGCAQPVEVSKDMQARGHYKYTADTVARTTVHCLNVADNNNFLTQRLCIKRKANKARTTDALKAHSLFIGNCFHHFHAEELDNWLAVNASCPICKEKPNLH